jgi:hypothetical protein
MQRSAVLESRANPSKLVFFCLADTGAEAVPPTLDVRRDERTTRSYPIRKLMLDHVDMLLF